METEKMLLPLKEASEKIGIGLETLRKLTYRKDFPIAKVGSKRLVIINLVEDWFSKHRGEELYED